MCKESDCTSTKNDPKTPNFKKFKHKWLNGTNWWLSFAESEGMYCLVCKKHQMKHPQNQRDVFANTPSVRFKVDAINTHVNSKLHTVALQNELLQQVSVFHKEVTKKAEVNTSVLEQVFSSAYFLMKEFIANRKLIPVLNFIQKIFQVDALQYFQHRSARSQTEIFLTLGDAMKEEVLKKARTANAFGLLTDEVADISVKENLVTFIQFFDRELEETVTKFLSCKNIMEKYSAADAESITNLLLEEMENDSLDIANLTGFTSDGASVMVGKKSGVAARLRDLNPVLINIHCVCHRLALSCADSNESINYIKNVETILRQLWQLFDNSPKKMAVFLDIQEKMKKIKMGSKARKLVGKRLKKACRTRWLSLEASVKAVFEEYEILLHTLSSLEKNDAAACGLLKKLKTLKFLGVIYILRDILPILADLSRHFQRDSLNFSAISPLVQLAKDKLRSLLDGNKPIESLRSDIDSLTNMCTEITMSKKDSDELSSLFKNYVNALIVNIERRFEDSSAVVSSLSVFDPSMVPKSEDLGFKEYGQEQIRTLGHHFYQEKPEDEMNQQVEKLLTEWQGMKYHINDYLKKSMPESVKDRTAKVTQTEWLLTQLLRNENLVCFFPGLVYLAEVALSLPVSNAWPERGASALKNVKTKQRNLLGNQMLEAILQVCINGPSADSADGQSLVKQAVQTWVKAKNRRRLPRKSSGVRNIAANPTNNAGGIKEVEDVGVQTDNNVTINLEQEDEVKQILVEVRHAMKLMHLELEAEGDSDSDSNDDEEEDDSNLMKLVLEADAKGDSDLEKESKDDRDSDRTDDEEDDKN